MVSFFIMFAVLNAEETGEKKEPRLVGNGFEKDQKKKKNFLRTTLRFSAALGMISPPKSLQPAYSLERRSRSASFLKT